MWIGVISDTHGVLNPKVLDIFDGVDYILHGGDIGHPSVLEELSQVAPVSGVVGQHDDPEEFPFEKTLFRKWFDVGVYVHHRIGEPGNMRRVPQKDVESLDPQVVIFGHTHEAFNERVDDRLFFNPGPAGRRKMKLPRSIGLIELEGQLVRGEIVPLNGK